MSKKKLRNKLKPGYTCKNGELLYTGRWLKRYMLLRTCKRKHSDMRLLFFLLLPVLGFGQEHGDITVKPYFSTLYIEPFLTDTTPPYFERLDKLITYNQSLEGLECQCIETVGEWIVVNEGNAIKLQAEPVVLDSTRGLLVPGVMITHFPYDWVYAEYKDINSTEIDFTLLYEGPCPNDEIINEARICRKSLRHEKRTITKTWKLMEPPKSEYQKLLEKIGQ